MGTVALILGILGGLSAVTGIATAVEVVPSLGAALTETFWLMLAGVLFLAAIALSLGRGSYE